MTPPGEEAAEPVRFASAVVLSKNEVFEICEALAEAEFAFLRAGRAAQSSRVALLFEMIEARLSSGECRHPATAHAEARARRPPLTA